MKRLFGVASGFFAEPTSEKWRSAVEAGLTEAELGFSYGLSDGDMAEKAERDYKMLVGSGVSVSSCHLPFVGYDISSLDEPARSNAVAALKNFIGWSADRNIKMAILHASFEPISPEERPMRLEKSAENIRELGRYANERGVVLAVENLPRTCIGNCSDEMLFLTDSGKNAAICFDVNHLLIETHAEFYEKVAPYAVTTHLSDYDRIDERHWIPGDGCIDWGELGQLFEKRNYAGRYIFEIDENSSPKLCRAFSPAELIERFKKIIKQGGM